MCDASGGVAGDHPVTDGIGTNATFQRGWLYGLAISPDGATLYLGGSSRVRKMDIAARTVTTLAGGSSGGAIDGVVTSATFNLIEGVAVTPDGQTLFVAECNNGAVRAINISTRNVTTVVGGTSCGGSIACVPGVGTEARVGPLADVAVSSDGQSLYMAALGSASTVFHATLS